MKPAPEIAVPGLIGLLLIALLSLSTVYAAENERAAQAAGEETEEPEDKVKKPEDEKFRLLPIPIFITEPAIGEGLGVALALFHPVKEGKSEKTRIATLESIGDMPDSREAPPVVTAVAGAYTNSESWAGGIGHFNNWRNDSIR